MFHNVVVYGNIQITKSYSTTEDKTCQAIDVNCRGYDGKTPVLVACSFVPEDKDSDSLLSLVDRLIRGGANPNVQDPIGRTPLMYAVRYSLSTDIITLQRCRSEC